MLSLEHIEDSRAIISTMSNILATKMHRPARLPNRVPRPAILRRLEDGLAAGRQVMLVSAPAGFGKTTCVSEWLDTLQGWPVAWLSLDASDDDPGRFFTYLLASLQQVDEHIGQEIAGILHAGQLPPSEILLTTLINDIERVGSRFLLVMDDLHVIQDAFILQVLETLVENLPRPLHLMLLTREDPPLPLARLRANDRLTEVRAADLRFNQPEAASFLNNGMGLSLSDADIAALEQRTEGWVVGLHLAGLSIRNREDPSAFIASLSGSQRYILSYLTEEVLNRQPEEIQHFLLATSILDRLNGDLCNAVTRRADSHAMLERLYRLNLFLVPLDENGNWYRYHQLFADLLCERQNMLPKEDTAELHQRASRWYSQAGMVNEAIQHALTATDYAAAVHLIERHAMDMLMEWHVKTVNGWMQSIPPEWCAQSPRANLVFAWLYLMRGTPQQAFPYLSRLEELFLDPRTRKIDPSLEAKWLAIQAMLLNAQQKPVESLQLCRRALEIVPAQEDQVRSMIDLEMANAYQQLNDHEHAVEAFQHLIRLGQAVGNSVFELLGISALALLDTQHGRLHQAFELASGGIQRAERSGSLPPICMAIFGELAVIHYQWHQLEQAHQNFHRAIQVGALSGYSDAELFYAVILSRQFQIQDDLDGAAREVQKAVDLMKIQAAVVVREDVIAQQVRILLLQGCLAEAESILKAQESSRGKTFSEIVPGQSISRPAAVLLVTALRILLYRAVEKGELGDVKNGIGIADQLVVGALQYDFIPFAMELLLVRAQLYEAVGDESASRADLTRALELGQPEGIISLFLEEGQRIARALKSLLERGLPDTLRPDYVRQILAAFPAQADAGRPPASEPLTDREMDVLRLMVDGLKYEEIAARLFVSLNTVRSHVKGIYGKLGVDNRTKAIQAARQMRLL
jgi:LuxR family transcriptional regulator, maltose regulon positive regulatory protein